MIVDWLPGCPQEVRGAVEPLIQRWTPLIPTWVQEFSVEYDTDRQHRMAMTANYPNRWAKLHVTSEWLKDEAREREVSLVHEIVHICMEPLCQAASRVIQDLTEEKSTLRELADSFYSDGVESTVEDTARAIIRCREA